jgi:hypothetical protein
MNWITSGNRNDRHNALPPELFRKNFSLQKLPVKAMLRVTALGIYHAEINGQMVDDSYFAPGYTCYEKYVQVQSYDVMSLLQIGENRLDVTVANGWYLGSIGRKNNNYGNIRALAAELTLTFTDGEQRIETDESWLVTEDTPTRYADFYNGETIDLTRLESGWHFRPAIPFAGQTPEQKPHFGAFVREDCRLQGTQLHGGVYDFGQNHAGVICITAQAKAGAVITVIHGEILDSDGHVFRKNLRGAKQTLTLTCCDGINEFHPRFTFMGFRYAEITITGEAEITKLESLVLTSDCKRIGEFSCSDEKLNRLYQNTVWGQNSNFIDIPTDCPQRDERMGWTGDIAVFAETAAYHRDIHDFMRKWLYDLRLYQRSNGSLPVTVPENKTYNPTPFKVPIAIWGDAATMVPWAVYRAYGDKELLAKQYDSMKAYADAELRAAAKTGSGDRKYLWDRNPFQYGDWCAPGGSFHDWKSKGKYLATHFMANSVNIVRQAAHALGKTDDEQYYAESLTAIKNAYAKLCIAEDGKLVGDFLSNYVCALYFGLVPEKKKAAVAKRMAELVREGDHTVRTGFAGTPYLCFALTDHGYVEDAYKVLQNEKCPGWLYTVNAGATTTWERWDALDENGRFYKGGGADMVSFNHYAYGSIGAFFYRRILGIEAVEAGFSSVRIAPVIGGTLTHAEGSLQTPHGKVSVSWRRDFDKLHLEIAVPEGVSARIILPDGQTHTVCGGNHKYETEGTE